MASDAGAPLKRPGLPATIGRYRIVDRVGRGAMGVVYAAQDEEMGRPVAIKVLMGDLEHDPESRARFYREAQAAAGLLHPNIITIYDAGEDQGRSFIAMQLLEGWPLAPYLKRPEAAPLERKLDLMVQVCEGLAAAHARSIVHRDLKPGNLFVQPDGLLKILDFGVARLADSRMTATGMMLGTPDYMSPEQARGTQVDTRSDIFSAGAVFYFMLAGRKPFPGPDLPAVLRQLQSESPAPLPAAIPEELQRIVMQAMAKDPDHRPTRIQELHTALTRFRRAYDAETRRLIGEVQARFGAASDAEQEAVAAARALELSPEYERSSTLGHLRETYPGVVDKRIPHDGLPPHRQMAERALEETEAEQHRLESEARRFGAWVQALTAAERQLQAGDAREALVTIATMRAEHPASQRLQRFVAVAEPAAEEQERLDREAERLAADARAAIGEGAWDRARTAIEEGLALRPDSETLRVLQREMEAGAERARQHRLREAAAARARAAAAIEAERFDEAAAALDEAETYEPDGESTARVRAQLAGAQAAAAERARVQLLAQREIRHARAMFRRGDYRDGLDALATFTREHPQAQAARDEADRLSRLHARIEQASRARREQSGTLTATARALAEQNALPEAIGRAREAVLADGSDPSAVTLLSELIERDLARRLQDAREAAARMRDTTAARLLDDARRARARGYIGEALTLASSAAAVAPENVDVMRLVAELRAAMASEDEDHLELGPEPFASEPEPAVAPIVSAAASQTPPAAPPRAPIPEPEGGVLGWLRRRRNPGA